MNPLTVRTPFLIAAAVAAGNIALFGLLSPWFIREVHHHWMVPFFAACFCVQAAAAMRLRPAWGGPVYTVLFVLAYLTAAIFSWRQFSMFQCYRHCEGRLAVALALLALTFLAGWRSTARRGSRLALWSAAICAVWGATVAVLGLLQGTLNFS